MSPLQVIHRAMQESFHGLPHHGVQGRSEALELPRGGGPQVEAVVRDLCVMKGSDVMKGSGVMRGSGVMM